MADPVEQPPWRVAGLAPMPVQFYESLFEGLAVAVRVPSSREPDALLEVLTDAEIVIGDWSGELILGARELDAAPSLAFVQQPSVGVDPIDLAACAARGIPVANTAGANATSVAEWCLAAALVLLRSMPWADAQVRAGQWPQLTIPERGCRDLAAQRVGLVGFGDIGVACAERFGALGCDVAYWSRRRRPPEEQHGARYAELDEVIASCDVLVVVVALADETRGLLDARRLALLPDQAVLVDASRGGIVDEDAVADALAAGRLGGAAFDVFAEEPLAASSRLREAERVLLSPHVAGSSVQARAALLEQTVANVARATTGEPVRDVVNDTDPRVRRH